MTAADRQPEVSPGGRLHAPATLRNRTPIAAVLARWLPSEGLVVELASGTGEHVLHFAAAFPHLVWQPSDPAARSEEHTSELQSLMRISYAVFFSTKQTNTAMTNEVQIKQ